VASPLFGDALLMVATLVFDELQVTDVVRFCVVPFEYVPVAVNCCVAPMLIDGFAGVTEIDVSVGFTVSCVEPETELSAACICVVPAATPVAKPPVLIVATLVLDELHVTVVVRFCVVPFEYVPVAVNCCVAPILIDGFAGAIDIDVSVGFTVSSVAPVTKPCTALI